MYSCYDSYVVYGICENNYKLILDSEILENLEQYDIRLYAKEVVRNHICSAVYGYTLSVDVTTGMLAQVPVDVKQILETLHQRMLLYHGDSNKPILGYFTVVVGDYDTNEHHTYKPE